MTPNGARPLRFAAFAVAGLALLSVCCVRSTDSAKASVTGGSAKFYAGAQIQEIYRLSLDRDDLLLESINAAIEQYDVRDGAVLSTVGTTQECTYHYVKSDSMRAEDVFVTQKGAAEILSAAGLIASGEPHIHITLSTAERDAFGGHLENGCKVLYLAEVTLAKFSGPPLERKPNQNRIPILGPK